MLLLLIILITANGSVCFESVQHPGQHLGILADGSLKQPTATGRGDHGQFHIILDVPVSRQENAMHHFTCHTWTRAHTLVRTHICAHIYMLYLYKKYLHLGYCSNTFSCTTSISSPVYSSVGIPYCFTGRMPPCSTRSNPTSCNLPTM